MFTRGYHVVDDAIGTYTFSMRQLKTTCNGAWSGTVGLKKVRSGKLSLTMNLAKIDDAIISGKQRESSGLSDVEAQGGGGIAEGLQVAQAIKSVEAILQVTRRVNSVWESSEKGY